MSKATLNRLLNDFYPYAKDYLGFDKDVDVYFVSDAKNGNKPLGKTAYYDPAKSEISVYTDNRHTKDIMRSVSHELVHHTQNCRGDLGMSENAGEGYAQNDGHLREMEREAYEKGNLCFRDWEDGIKANVPPGTIYESRAYRSKNIMPNFKILNENFKSFLIESDYQRGDEVEIVGSVNAGAKGIIQEPMAGYAVIELTEVPADSKYGKEGDLIKVKDEYIEKPGYMSGGETPMNEAEFVGHHAEIDGKTYVDSNFLNKVKSIRDSFPHELKSMGFGEFYLETPKGKVQFDRSRGQSVQGTVPSFVGRAHQLYGEPPELADELMAAMEAAGASEVVPIGGDGGFDDEGYSKVSGSRPMQEANEGGEGVHDIFNMPAEESPEGLPPGAAIRNVNDPDAKKEAALRQIVAQHQAAKIDGVMVDAFTASAIVQILDALKPNIKVKYLGEPIQKMAAMAMKMMNESRRKINKRLLKEYGDHETQARGGEVASSYSANPEMDQIEDIGKTVAEQGGGIEEIAAALSAEGFRVASQGRTIDIDGKYTIGSPKDIGQDDQTVVINQDIVLDTLHGTGVTEASGSEKLSPEDKEWHKSVMNKGKVPNLKGDMGPMPGMEGPFQFKSGAVLYYDSKSGQYYDRGKDMYIDNEEAGELTMEIKNMKLREKVTATVMGRLKEMYDDDDPYADDDPYMAGLEAEFPWLADKKKGAVPASPEDEAAAAAAAADAAAAGDFAVPGEEEEEGLPRVMKEEGEWTPPSSRDDVKYGGKIHMIPDIRFSGDITTDIQGLPSEILNWMWGELESADAIEDEFGRNYAGADVQDAVQELPDELFEKDITGEAKAMRLKTNIFEDETAFTETLRGRVMKRLQTLQEKGAKSSEKHDDDPALKGDQDELPDKLQKNIIDSEDEEKNESLRDRVRRIVQETLNEHDDDDKKEDEEEVEEGKKYKREGEDEEDEKAKTEGKQPPWLKKDKEDDESGDEEEEKNEHEKAEGDDPEADKKDEDKEDVEEQIASNPEDFFRKLRNESRKVVKEDWSKDSKTKRSAMLNERLMKSWFNK